MMPRSRFKLPQLLLLLLLLLLGAAAAFSTCPIICTCKWKNGKFCQSVASTLNIHVFGTYLMFLKDCVYTLNKL